MITKSTTLRVPEDLIERAIALYPKIKSTPGYKAVCVRSPWAFVGLPCLRSDTGENDEI
jgi:hypothetical protein